MTDTLGHWEVPNYIGVIREDLGPCEVFNFMGDVGVSRKQTRPKPGEKKQTCRGPERPGILYGCISGLRFHGTENCEACQEMERIQEQAQGVQILSKHTSEYTS